LVAGREGREGGGVSDGKEERFFFSGEKEGEEVDGPFGWPYKVFPVVSWPC
jgi:hypothetical protein